MKNISKWLIIIPGVAASMLICLLFIYPMLLVGVVEVLIAATVNVCKVDDEASSSLFTLSACSIGLGFSWIGILLTLLSLPYKLLEKYGGYAYVAVVLVGGWVALGCLLIATLLFYFGYAPSHQSWLFPITAGALLVNVLLSIPLMVGSSFAPGLLRYCYYRFMDRD